VEHIFDGHLVVFLNLNVFFVIWESLIDGFGKIFSVNLCGLESGNGLWISLDHHGHGHIVVISWIFLFGSVLLQDGVEGVVTDDLSECLQSDGLDVVKFIGGGGLNTNGFNFIDWDLNELGSFVDVLLLGTAGGGGENLTGWRSLRVGLLVKFH